MSNWMRNILNDKRKVSFMILLIAVVIATAVLILYKVVSSAILSINISSMEELAAMLLQPVKIFQPALRTAP